MSNWKRIGAGVGALVLIGAVGFSGYVRLVPADPAVWNVDPLTAPDPATPNFARIAPGEIVGGDVATLADRADAAMRGMDRTRLLAGSVADGQMTYITRSLVMGFPDFTSIHVFEQNGEATLAAFARSRFGKSDMGVNQVRIDALRAALTP